MKPDITSSQASRGLANASTRVQNALEKLSSGTRIPNAKDDASGLSISSAVRLDRVALQSARINVLQAGSLLQVADGALASMVDILTRMNSLSVQSSNGTIGNTERVFLDQEFQLLKSELNRINSTATFNNQNILGATPEYRLDFQGTDIDNDDGVVGIDIDNRHPLITGPQSYEVSYDSINNTMTLRNVDQNYFESELVNLPSAGEVGEVKFVELGITLKINSDFDTTTDIDPTINDSSFTITANAVTTSTFLPTDVADMALWYSADNSPIGAPGGIVQSIGDLETLNGGSNDAVQTTPSERPLLQNNSVFNKPALVFDGIDDHLTIANNSFINTSTHAQKSFAMSIGTGADVTTRQMIYEEGAQVNGMNAYIENGNLYIGVWRSNGTNNTFVSTPISANTDYTFSYTFDATTDSVDAYLNGTQFAATTGIGAALPAHSGGNALGGVNGLTRNHNGGQVNALTPFGGAIAEIAYYNTALTAAEHANLHTYLTTTTITELLFSSGELSFQVGNQEIDTIVYDIPDTDRMLDNVSSTNILSVSFAGAAITDIDGMIESISTYRSNIGATMNRLEFAGSNLDITIENLTGVESIIQDTDVASEVTELLAASILEEVTISMLSKANEELSTLLQLLRF